MRIFRNGAPPNERFLIDASFDELREVNAVIRQTSGHLCSDELAAKFNREIDGLFPESRRPAVPASPRPLVQTGQGSYRRNWPAHIAELLGGDPAAARAENRRAGEQESRRPAVDVMA